MEQIYKNHKITLNLDQDGTWIYEISGPILNETKTFSRISSNNKTIENWKKSLDKA